ncbi:MAG: agmatine deiminase family protein [Ectothiorhodospiraceae bacterium]|nr:agmatine deiminase family protein [Ectothiorhodospiraceae bacterium]
MGNIHLPAEWEQQSGVMLVWPHSQSDWAGHLLAVEETYREIVSAISQHEIALVVCFDDAHRKHIGQQLTAVSTIDNLRFAIAPSNDSWVRDTGPITLRSSGGNYTPFEYQLLDFTFNGWGEKHPSTLDNLLTRHLHSDHHFPHCPVRTRPMVLEGGSIESDGQGTLLTTTRCLNNANRNPDLSLRETENRLKNEFGADRVLWLTQGFLLGDDTDGHIDTLARFCPDNTIVYSACTDPSDVHYPSLGNMAVELAAFTTADGQPYRLKPLPIPAAIYNAEGARLPANYANFLVINNAVLVPTYNDPNDKMALQTIAASFPRRTITGIDCRSLLQQLGSLHCATMQFPFGVLQ